MGAPRRLLLTCAHCMKPPKLIRSVAQAALPQRATAYAEDKIRSVRFRARAQEFRSRYGLRPAKRPLTILTYPESIATMPGILLARLCSALGYHVTALPSREYDVAVKYQDATFTTPSELASLPVDRPVINRESLDISKERVDQEVEAVFGRGTLVDPTTYRGSIVEKSNLNSRRGWTVVEAPLAARREGFVYQRLIDSTTGDGHYVEYRVPVHDGRIPLVYRKVIDERKRFAKTAESVTIEQPEEHFSAEELDGIRRVCRAMGVDFGELDVLRDRTDGVPYVIDVNHTPYGQLKELDDAGRARAYRTLAASFQQMCESRLAG